MVFISFGINGHKPPNLIIIHPRPIIQPVYASSFSAAEGMAQKTTREGVTEKVLMSLPPEPKVSGLIAYRHSVQS